MSAWKFMQGVKNSQENSEKITIRLIPLDYQDLLKSHIIRSVVLAQG